MVSLSKILIFPIKSLDPVSLNEIEISSGGTLKGDREFAIVDRHGKYINAKLYPQIHLIRANYHLSDRQIHLQIHHQKDHQKDHQKQEQNEVFTFHLDRERELLANWLSEFFGQPVELRQNIANGFPDDLEAWGPTVVSEASLKTVQSWYEEPNIDLEQIRRRFRTNLEISGTAPFGEDRLFTKSGETVPFRIGSIQFLGINPCQRCPVPTRDADTGEIYPKFQKIFSSQRAATLPDNVERSRFNHFYRFTLNTRIPVTEAGKVLKLGDSLLVSP